MTASNDSNHPKRRHDNARPKGPASASHTRANSGENNALETPLCQFGPGGAYKYADPASAELLGDDPTPRGLDKLARDLGLEAPLVAAGPGGIEFAPRTSALKHVVQSMLDVLRQVKSTGSDAISDQALIAEQIASADATLGTMQAQPMRLDVLAEARAPLAGLALSTRGAGRLTADAGLRIAQDRRETVATHYETEEFDQALHALQEDDHGTGYTETDGDSAIHSRLSGEARLFPDDAGDWGPSGSLQGHRLRTRRGTRRKKAAPAGRQAQGSLFAAVE